MLIVSHPQVAAITLFNPGHNSTVNRRLTEEYLAKKRLSYYPVYRSPSAILEDLAQEFVQQYNATCEDKRANETNSTCPCLPRELGTLEESTVSIISKISAIKNYVVLSAR